MPYKLLLNPSLAKAGWKVSIYDGEGPEEPHVSIRHKGRNWRLSLRTQIFLDHGAEWRDIDPKVKAAIQANWQTLQSEWDKRYGDNNPV